ncbi:MAG TPA: sialate O-acetylesterase [Gemmataceae bacterium]
MVALAFGQSNAANSGDVRHASGDHVFNFYLGRLYRARDPLLGATADGGSVWTRLGDMVIAAKMYDAVIFAPIAVGRSEIRRWAPDGDLHPVLVYTLRDLREHGIPPTHLLWHQGESDYLTSTEDYKARFRRMMAGIRREEPDAPVFVSIASKREDAVYENVRRAQAELIDPAERIYAGPDTDTLGDDWRNAIDHAHFNERGLWKCAELWLGALRRAEAAPPG